MCVNYVSASLWRTVRNTPGCHPPTERSVAISLSYLVLMVMWPPGGLPLGVTIVEQKNQRTHSSIFCSRQPCDHVIFTPFSFFLRVSGPVLTRVRARHDKVTAHGPAGLHFDKLTCILSLMLTCHFLWILFTWFTPPPHPCLFAPIHFLLSSKLEDRWTENHRACVNAFQ